MLSPKRIVIIEPVFTNYRLPVYQELSGHSRLDWIFSPAPENAGYGSPAVESLHSNLHYHLVPAIRPLGNELAVIQWGIFRYLLRERPDAILVSADLSYLSFWTTLLAARFLGIPTYAHGHGLYKRKRLNRLRRSAVSTMLRFLTGYIAYSPMVRESFSKHGFGQEKIGVAHISLVVTSPVLPQEKRGGERGILFLGRLRPNSQLPLLLQTVALLRRQDGADLTVEVIGSGASELLFRREYGDLPWVNWHGQIYDQRRIREISLNCFVGCCPGDVGLGAVHLMALSLPLVTHDQLQAHGPEVSYIRNGSNGVLFDHRDPATSLYQALRELAFNPLQTAALQRGAFETFQELADPSLAERLWSILSGSPTSDQSAGVVLREVG